MRYVANGSAQLVHSTLNAEVYVQKPFDCCVAASVYYTEHDPPVLHFCLQAPISRD